MSVCICMHLSLVFINSIMSHLYQIGFVNKIFPRTNICGNIAHYVPLPMHISKLEIRKKLTFKSQVLKFI